MATSTDAGAFARLRAAGFKGAAAWYKTRGWSRMIDTVG